MHRAATSFLGVTGLAFAMQVVADENEWLYPAPVKTWQIEGGYRIPAHNDGEETSYYRVTYKGSLVDEDGTPLQASQHFEITEPKTTAPGGDRNELELVLQRNNSTLGGELFEMNGLTPLSLRGLDRLKLRGAAYVGTDFESDSLKAAVGLETRPFRVPGVSGTGASNWFVLGVMAERSEATDEIEGDSTYGLVTGRIFSGKAFGWHKKARIEDTAKAIEASILGKASDLAAGRKLATELSQIKAVDRTALQQLLIDTVGEVESDDDWERAVRDMSIGTADALTDQSTFALYFEATGWHAFSEQEGIPRSRGLATLTADYWPLKTRDDVILRARYEWGFQRTQPNLRVNQLLITVTLSF